MEKIKKIDEILVVDRIIQRTQDEIMLWKNTYDTVNEMEFKCKETVTPKKKLVYVVHSKRNTRQVIDLKILYGPINKSGKMELVLSTNNTECFNLYDLLYVLSDKYDNDEIKFSIEA